VIASTVMMGNSPSFGPYRQKIRHADGERGAVIFSICCPSKLHRPRPPFQLPCQVPLRPVTGMIRGGAHAARLTALAAHLV
jgi:hypothetical protein